jgi:hypothetical protein
MVHVFSIGGALISQVNHHIERGFLIPCLGKNPLIDNEFRKLA